MKKPYPWRWILLVIIWPALVLPAASRGDYNKVEIRFTIPDLDGNPFDIVRNDIWMRLRLPDGSMARLPAFFDGGDQWAVRYTPTLAGRHTVIGVFRNGARIETHHLAPTAFQVEGPVSPGFVRRDPEHHDRFVLDSGAGYYPMGYNAAWGDGKDLTIPVMLERMGRAGVNWSRIWMCHWDGKNLDWVERKTLPEGVLDLGVARYWDEIVETAERGGVHFQMVLQHHGPYSTSADSNWGEHPWNAANGGFLQNPEEFFTHPRALALTRAKYRYIAARWGYSPSVMAWELFNEVQWTDALRNGRRNIVAAWHNQMADFLRHNDPHRHLVTSSFRIDPAELGDRLDYWQPHAYVPDPMTAVLGLNGLNLDRPVFLGEIGPADGSPRADAAYLHRLLWGSMMSEASGAAQLWAWDAVHGQNLFPVFENASAFLRWSQLSEWKNLKAFSPVVRTAQRGPLTISPGGGWQQANTTTFTITPGGIVPGAGAMPRYLQGTANKRLFPQATFHVDYPTPGTFTVRFDQVARLGARVVLSLDGTPRETRVFAASESDRPIDETIRIDVPAGRHTILLDSTGVDWVTIHGMTLDPYAPTLSAQGKGNGDRSVLWLENRSDSGPVRDGTVTLPGQRKGAYRVQWWNPQTAKPLREDRLALDSDGDLVLSVPPVDRDIACRIQRASRG